jgi:hypothetical protein
MRWVARHAVASAIVVVASAVVAAVFAFDRPQVHTTRTEEVVHMAGGRHLSRSQVVQAFAAQEIELQRSAKLGSGEIFSDRHAGDSLTVTIFAADAVVHFATTGPKVAVEERIGNVEVFYGGKDKRFAHRIAAAAFALH